MSIDYRASCDPKDADRTDRESISLCGASLRSGLASEEIFTVLLHPSTIVQEAWKRVPALQPDSLLPFSQVHEVPVPSGVPERGPQQSLRASSSGGWQQTRGTPQQLHQQLPRRLRAEISPALWVSRGAGAVMAGGASAVIAGGAGVVV